MAWSFLASILEEGEPLSLPPKEQLDDTDRLILQLALEGSHLPEISSRVGLPEEDVRARLRHPLLQEHQGRVERHVAQKLTRAGDYEPLQAARAEAPKAMARMIQQSRTERDPRVRLQAHQAVLKYAGVEPARKLEITTPDKILDQMTPDELALFAAKRLWPARFKEALRAFIAPSIDVTPEPKRRLAPPDEGRSPFTMAPSADLPASTLPPPPVDRPAPPR